MAIDAHAPRMARYASYFNSVYITLISITAWSTPTIELAIITHDRPWSLTRLLDSVSRAHYFGDRVNVVINLEQTADTDTRRIAEAFTMAPAKGQVTVRHRIVYAGLMAAVVESWHPHGNHSYGAFVIYTSGALGVHLYLRLV